MAACLKEAVPHGGVPRDEEDSLTVETTDGVIEGRVVHTPARASVPPVRQPKPKPGTPEAVVAEIRVNLSRAEQAHGEIAEDMAALRDEFDWSLRRIAEEIGCGKSTVDRHLKWWELRADRPELAYGETVKALKAPKPEPVVEEDGEPEDDEPVVAKLDPERLDACQDVEEPAEPKTEADLTREAWERIIVEIETLAEDEHGAPAADEMEMLVEALARFGLRVVSECGTASLGATCRKQAGHEGRCYFERAAGSSRRAA